MAAPAVPLGHRAVNRDLRVLATDALAGSGLPPWLPDGAVIREELQALARDWAKFSRDMLPPMAVGGDELVLRPANCPHHALVCASEQRSWRELPLRPNELAAMFRAAARGLAA